MAFSMTVVLNLVEAYCIYRDDDRHTVLINVIVLIGFKNCSEICVYNKHRLLKYQKRNFVKAQSLFLKIQILKTQTDVEKVYSVHDFIVLDATCSRTPLGAFRVLEELRINISTK